MPLGTEENNEEITNPNEVIDIPEAEYQAAEEKRSQLEKETIKASLSTGVKEKPKNVTEAMSFSKKFNLPLEFVKNNKDLLLQQHKIQQVDIDQLHKKSPVTARHLSDINRATLSQNDIAPLTSIEEKMKLIAPAEIKRGFLGDLWSAGGESLANENAGDILLDGLQEGGDMRQVAENVAYYVKRANERSATDPDYHHRANKVIGKKEDELLNEWARLKQNFDINKLDKVLDDLGPKLLHTTAAAMDVIGTWASHPRALIYGNTKSIATGIKPIVYGGLGAAVVTATAIAFPPLGIPLAAASIAGGVGGAFYGSQQAEMGGSVLEQVRSAGYDPSNPDSLMEAFKDEKLMGEILPKAAKKGTGTALIDTALTLAGGRVLKGIGKGASVATKIKKGAMAQTLEVLSEGGGEFGGAFWRDDFDWDKVDGKEILAEMRNSLLSGGAVVSATGQTILEGGKQIVQTAEKVAEKQEQKERIEAEVQELRKLYPDEPEAALRVLGQDWVKAQQSYRDYQTIEGLFDDMARITDTKEVEGEIKRFTEEATGMASEEAKVYYNSSDDFDHYATKNGFEPTELIKEMSKETQEQYAKAKTDNSNFEMSASDFASVIATKPELREMGKYISVREDGVDAIDAITIIKRSDALHQQIAKEAKKARTKNKDKLTTKTKIQQSLAAKIRLGGFSKAEATPVSQILTKSVETLSTLTKQTPEEFFSSFSLNFTKKPITSETKSAIIERAKLEEQAALAAEIEGIPEVTAQKILGREDLTVEQMKEMVDSDLKRDLKVEEIVDAIRSTDKKFGEFTKPVAHDKLPHAELKEVADEMLSDMIDQFAFEVKEGEKGSRAFIDVDPDAIDPTTDRPYNRTKDKIIKPSTFPKDYREVGARHKDRVPEAITKFRETGKKNALYKKIEKVAKNRLVNGFELHGELISPDNTYRSTVGMPMLDEKRQPIKHKTTLFNQERDGKKIGKIDILNRNFLIDILKKGDTISLMHEVGHAYLELARIAVEEIQASGENTRDQQEFMNQMTALLEYLGVNSFEEIGTDQHEKFAETFVAWVGTGKAPSADIQKAFFRFKQWVIGFFKDIKNTGFEITPEIDRFMGALMATKEEVDISSMVYNQTDTAAEAMLLGLSEDKALDYQRARITAKMEAQSELGQKLINTERKKQLKEQNKHRKEFKAGVEAEVAKDNRYNAVDRMRSNKQYAMSKAGIQELMGKGFLKRLPHGIYIIEGGFHPDEVAQAFSFSDGISMLEQLDGLKNKDVYIKEETQRRLDAAFPDILSSDQELERAANDAMANEKQAMLYRMEIDYWLKNEGKLSKAFIKKISKQLKTSKQYKDQAVKKIDNTTLANIQPHKFANKVKSFGRKAGEAFARGRFEEMIEFKVKQIENVELQREAKKAKEYRQKQEKKFKNLSYKEIEGKKKQKKIDIDIINGARQILENFEIGVVDSEKLAKDLDTLARNDERKAQVIMNPVNKLEVDFKNYKELTYSEFVEVSETVNALVEMARDDMMVTIEGQKIDVEKAIKKINAQLDEGIKKSGAITRKPTLGDRIYDRIQSAKASARRVEHFGTAVDLGDKINGAFTNFIVKPVLTAVNHHRTKKNEYLRKYKDLVDTRNLVGWEKGSIDASKELGYTFKDKQELLGHLLHIGNDSNKAKLLLGHGWAKEQENGSLLTRWDEFFARAIEDGIITEADMDFVQGVWDLMEELKPDAQKAHKKIEGFFFDEIESNSFEAFGKTYKGGYAPVVIDGFFNEDARSRIDEESFLSAENSFMWPSTGKGFTISRNGAVARVNTDINIFASHLDKVTRYAYIMPAIKDANKIVFNHDFKEKLGQYDKHARSRMIIPWLQRAASQRVTTVTTDNMELQNLSKIMRTNIGMQRMALNVVNTLQQFTGLSIAMVRIDAGYLWNGLISYAGDRAGTKAMMNEKSEFMRERIGGQMADMTQEIKGALLDPDKLTHGRDVLRANAYILQEITQGLVDSITWLGGYDQAIAQGLSEKDAVWAADSAVRETQGSFTAEDISSLEAGSPLQRLFTMFYSYFNMQANLMGTEFHIAIEKHGLKKAPPKMMISYFYGIVLPAFMSDLLIKGMSGKFDEDEDGEIFDEFARSLFNSTARGTFSLHPATGLVGNGLMDVFLDDYRYNDDPRLSPVGQGLQAIWDLGTQASKAMGGKRINDKQAVRNTLEALGLVTGVPVAPLAKPYRYLRDMQDGKARPTNILDITRGVITGKSGR